MAAKAAGRRGMNDSGSGAGEVFDLQKIHRLVELMKEHDLCEIDLHQGDQGIRLKRAGEVTMAPVATVAPAAPSKAAATTSSASTETDTNLAVIKSPMVGTFYAAAGPESPPFVKVGDHVGVDTTVCIIEAMKVFNEVPAEISGKIVAILVLNGDPVEYNQPLFRVDTSK